MFYLFPTPPGDLIIGIKNNKLTLCNWMSEYKGRTDLKNLNDAQPDEDSCLKEVCMALNSYLKCELISFSLPYELYGTPFQISVWKEMAKIPYGETITYGELAERIGKPKASRAVANACGANPLSIIIPCHRVVAAGGKLGGYTGGLDKKIYLLNLEMPKTFSKIFAI